eukprot:g44576.t1
MNVNAGVGRTGVFIALDHLIQHVNHHDFVDIFGFVAELRSERMCMVQNLRVPGLSPSNITKAVDNGELVDVVYLDFQKAFANVPYKRLLHKMKVDIVT